MTVAIIIAITLLLVIFYIIATYNSLIRKRNMAEEGWSGIDVQLKRRHDLIPNLIEVVKKYAEHEKELFANIASSREKCLGAGNDVKALSAAEGKLASSLKSVFALSEAYPELRSDQNFLDFQNELSEIEDHIQMARRYYNGTARELNISIDSFPSNLVASKFNFTRRDYFEANAEEKKNTKISFE